MARHKLIYLLLLTYAIYVASSEDETTETAKPRIDTLLKPPSDKLVLQKSTSYQKEQPSFFSRLASWFNPFGGSTETSIDLVSAEDHNGRQYLPPPLQSPHQYHPQSGCQSDCNKEPWIPVASKTGKETVINFVPPSSHANNFNSIENLNPPPLAQYGAPVPPIFKPVPDKINYGIPMPLNNNQRFPKQNPFADYGPPAIDLQDLRPPPYNGPVNGPVTPRFLRPQSQHKHRITHLKPLASNYGVPIDMRPPPLSGNYHTLPPTPPNTNYGFPNQFRPPPPPSPPPSDSYGAPVVGPDSNYDIRTEYLPPLDQAPLTSPDSHYEFSEPIPFPNLSSGPVAPIYNPGNFHADFEQYGDILRGPQNDHYDDSIEVVPSINVANFVESIEHPVNVIQSPVIDVSTNDQHPGVGEILEPKTKLEPSSPLPTSFSPTFDNNYGSSQNVPHSFQNGDSNLGPSDQGIKLSENPIVVEDTHTAATAVNGSYQPTVNNNDIQQEKPNNLSPKAISDQFGSTQELDLHANFLKQILLQQEISKNDTQDDKVQRDKTAFTPPSVDYDKWEPMSGGTISTSMVPPALGASTWLYPVQNNKKILSSTEKPKQVQQYIIPYIPNKIPSPFEHNQPRKVPLKTNQFGVYTTLIPVYSPPPLTQELEWPKYLDNYQLSESQRITATAFTASPTSQTTQVANIRDILKDSGKYHQQSDKLPFDVVSLQNHIDDLTQQEFLNRINYKTQDNIGPKLAASKKIPDEYFTTQFYSKTPAASANLVDHEPAGSSNKESKLDGNIQSNLIFHEAATQDNVSTEAITTVPKPNSQEGPKNSLNVVDVTESDVTNKKLDKANTRPYPVYQHPSTSTARSIVLDIRPKNNTVLSWSSPKFTVRVDPDSRTSRAKLQQVNPNGSLKVVFSEWPHIINNLETTTDRVRSTSKHPLLGLMDLSLFIVTPSPNVTVRPVQTISGHSKVVSVVTVTPSVIYRNNSENEESESAVGIVTPVA